MKKILTLFAAISLTAFVYAQKIIGTVKDEQGKPLNAANVTLQKAGDSSIVKINAVNTDGKYEFINIPGGKYFVAASFTGYTASYSSVFDVNGSQVTVPEIVMVKTSTNLAAVTIVSKKPMVEVKSDKT
ncbi:MAG: carboxypeptidase regulatory-like domain-containing protein, partial [Bacteroidia bacterium]|nr:carboxypeptidase regulatory-like domain-containing protein [Bacteroidia bacterium]